MMTSSVMLYIRLLYGFEQRVVLVVVLHRGVVLGVHDADELALELAHVAAVSRLRVASS